MSWRRVIINFLKYPLLLFWCLFLGTLWHEVIGHGLTGVLLGGRITYVEALGFQWWPQVNPVGFSRGYGACNVSGLDTVTRDAVCNLAGSLSTWVVSLAALVALWAGRWSGWKRTLLLLLGLWWVDLLTYTLPTWGVRRSVLWGAMYSEPYVAATDLGIPGPLFQAFVLATCIPMAFAWFAAGLRRPAAPGRDGRHQRSRM